MRALLLFFAICLAPGLAAAQPAALIADVVRVEADSRLIAEGDVQVAYRDTILTAQRVTYDRAQEQLFIDGPITLNDGDGAVFVADSATLDSDLREGILQSARLVLDRQLQLAATEIARVDGRYTQLANTVVSACEICADNPIPTWEIRARRVIHDNQEGLIYFDNATFRLFGVPIAYFPYLRLPDSTNTRQTGILIPSFVSNTELGFGIKQPLFITLGPHADVTLTPYVSSRTRTLEARYRQNFRRGAVNIAGAFSRDDLVPDDDRFYVIGSAGFVMPRGFRLEFDIEAVSDDSYLVDYDYSSEDRLQTEARLIKVERDLMLRGRITDYTTLRADELAIEDELPSAVTDFIAERHVPLGWGELRLKGSAGNIYRASDRPGVGRDVSELGVGAELYSRSVFGSGLVAINRADLTGSLYDYADAARDYDDGRVTGTVLTELRLPLQRSTAGAHHLIEPIAQLAFTETTSTNFANEDSVLVEFDQGNLFALSRFPGDDAVETGLRGSLGLSYTGLYSDGTGVALTFGRSFRDHALEAFVPGTGLRGESSDWLVAGQVSFGQRLDVTARMLLEDSNFSARKAETRVAYADDRFTFDGSYVFLEGEPLENRATDTHELIVDTSLRLSRHWIGSFAGRYDFTEDAAAEAGLGLTYLTECIEVEFELDRRFTRTPSIDAVTSFGVQVSLAGFGSGRYDESFRKTCKG